MQFQTVGKLLISVLATLTVGGFILISQKKNSEITVAFHFSGLKDSDKLIDPKNTETTGQYYLLENLAATLIKDDDKSPSGYKGQLAEKWEQVNSYSWRFYLKDNLLWSNNNPISCQEIKEHILYLKENPGRHINLIRSIKEIICDEVNPILEISFYHDVSSEILHEFSLADTGLIYHKNKLQNWSVTSGSYFVESYKKSDGILKLKKNPYSFQTNDHSPSTVHFVNISKDSDYSDINLLSKIDVFSIGSMQFRSQLKNLETTFPLSITSTPNLIYYFAFNPLHKDSFNNNLRKELAFVIHESLKTIKLNDTLKIYNQLVPPGYNSYLPSYITPRTNIKILKGKKVFLLLPYDQCRDIHPIFNNIKDFAKSNYGIDMEVIYKNELVDENQFLVKLSMFKGNQKDVMGSWTFLFSENNGPLSLYRQNYDQFTKEQSEILNSEEKRKHKIDFHRQILDNTLAIPVFLEALKTYHSKKVDLSSWNIFDMRLRLYDIKVNQ